MLGPAHDLVGLLIASRVLHMKHTVGRGKQCLPIASRPQVANGVRVKVPVERIRLRECTNCGPGVPMCQDEVSPSIRMQTDLRSNRVKSGWVAMCSMSYTRGLPGPVFGEGPTDQRTAVHRLVGMQQRTVVIGH